MPKGARELRNTFGFLGYGGPQPPSGLGRHEYRLTMYALDVASLDLPADVSLGAFEKAAAAHSLGTAEVSGFYAR